MSDIHPATEAFLSVMRGEQDFVLYRMLASIRRDGNKAGSLVDEGTAREYALLVMMLEDERYTLPNTIDEVLADTLPLSGKKGQELFNERKKLTEKLLRSQER